MHEELPNYSRVHKKRLVQSGHSLEAYLSVETGNCEGMREADIEMSPKPVYGYSKSQVLDAAQLIQVTFGTETSERKIYTCPILAPFYAHGSR